MIWLEDYFDCIVTLGLYSCGARDQSEWSKFEFVGHSLNLRGKVESDWESGYIFDYELLLYELVCQQVSKGQEAVLEPHNFYFRSHTCTFKID